MAPQAASVAVAAIAIQSDSMLAAATIACCIPGDPERPDPCAGVIDEGFAEKRFVLLVTIEMTAAVTFLGYAVCAAQLFLVGLPCFDPGVAWLAALVVVLASQTAALESAAGAGCLASVAVALQFLTSALVQAACVVTVMVYRFVDFHVCLQVAGLKASVPVAVFVVECGIVYLGVLPSQVSV